MSDAKPKKKRGSLSAYTILVLVLIVLAIVTAIMATAGVSGITAPKLSDVVMAPIKGFEDALGVCLFVLILGGFLGIVNETGALDTGIRVLVKKLKGRELMLIPILMFLFSIGGTTYGMCEETVVFYVLLAATMVAAGFDSLVGASVVLLGAGCGVLGSTVNPFAVGVAVDALKSMNYSINQALIMGLGVVLWLSTTLVSILYVMRYAKKVKAEKGSTILSLQEVKTMEEEFGNGGAAVDEDLKLSGKQKLVLILFAITFVIMIVSFIPWADLGVEMPAWTGLLTGELVGAWYFAESSAWFLLMAIIIGIFARVKESKFVNSFLAGSADMIGVVMIVALARSVTVLLNTTGLGVWILENAANALSGMVAFVFAPLSYLLLSGLSFLIPSSSGLATVAMPIMGGLAHQLNFSVETMVMIYSAANGLINLVTPTCGAIMGGLAIAKIEWTTWVKFSWKLLVILAVLCIVILTIAMTIIPMTA